MSRMLFVAFAMVCLPANAAVLTLSCNGTMKEEEQRNPHAIKKMGLIVDFDAGVVTGFTGITARLDEVNANSVLFKETTTHRYRPDHRFGWCDRDYLSDAARLPIYSVTEILHWTTFQEFASCCSTIVQISLHKNGMDTGRCQCANRWKVKSLTRPRTQNGSQSSALSWWQPCFAQSYSQMAL